MINELYTDTESWTALKSLEVKSARGDMAREWGADTSIGTDGVFLAHSRMLAERETRIYEKMDVDTVKRIYCDVNALTIKHRLRDPNGQDWNIISVDNPHNFDEFLQVDIVRIV